jgi:hypothetical protein
VREALDELLAVVRTSSDYGFSDFRMEEGSYMKVRSVLLAGFLLGSAGLTALVACSSDSSSGSSGSSGTTSGTVTVHVTAAAGGTVSDPAGKATLTIPPGAVATDTDITLNVGAAANGSAGSVLDFGPDGLKFLKPATLTVKTDGVTVPTGKSVSVAIFDGAAWKPLDGSKFANGTATADVLHFTKYSIVFIDGQVVLQPPANCAETASTFTACGGDPSGTWKFADFCIDAKSLGADPFKGNCPQFAASVDYKSDGVVTITGNASAGTLSTGPSTANTTITYTFPLSCTNAVTDGGLATCAEASKSGTTCTDTGSGNCSCVETSSKMSTGDTHGYTASGNILTNLDSNGQPSDSGEYCVKGGLLYYKEIKDGGQGVLYVLQKQ